MVSLLIHNLGEFERKINENQGYIKTMWCGDVECEPNVIILAA